MEVKRYKTVFFIVVLVTIFGCSNKKDSIDKKYYSDRNYKALQTITENFDIELSNKKTLLLVIRDTECFPCLQELQYWNNEEELSKEWNIRLFIVSKYKTSASYFLERENITVTTKIDTAYSFMRNDIVPQLPIKMLIENNEILKIEPMGSGSNLPSFIELMKN